MDFLLHVREELVNVAHELTHDQSSYPAGSVLRCYARAVQLARVRGCPDERLAETARRLAEESLMTRLSPQRAPDESARVA